MALKSLNYTQLQLGVNINYLQLPFLYKHTHIITTFIPQTTFQWLLVVTPITLVSSSWLTMNVIFFPQRLWIVGLNPQAPMQAPPPSLSGWGVGYQTFFSLWTSNMWSWDTIISSTMAFTWSLYLCFFWCSVLKLAASAKKNCGRSYGKMLAMTLPLFWPSLVFLSSPCLFTSCPSLAPSTSLTLLAFSPMMTSRFQLSP